MSVIKNPARSRPLSANVKRLMRLARESPHNPQVEKIQRPFTDRDWVYCDMQGSIFMAAVDRGVAMGEFAQIFMNSQLAGVIDYSFSCAGGMEEDDTSRLLQMPLLLKSPELIVDTVLWLDRMMDLLCITTTYRKASTGVGTFPLVINWSTRAVPTKRISLYGI